MQPDQMNLLGSCLCGKITYRIIGEIAGINYCHCKKCQKASGSAFATSAAVKKDDFEIITGQHYLSNYASSENKKRFFCNYCSSPIYSEFIGEPTRYIRLGTLDDDPIKRPEVHIHTDEKASWYAITDNLQKMKKDEGLKF